MSGRYSQVPTDFVDDLESGRFEDSETLEKETLLPGTLEREDYDVPPPGSPPASQLHLDIGNTNGVAPGEPERPSAPRWSIFQRMFGAMVPSRYTRVPAEASAPLVGGGALNDGVFANMAARPQKNVAVRTDDGNVHMVPEDAQDALPPSYAVAQLDRVPEYGASLVATDPNAEILFDDLAAGSWFLFVVSAIISFVFQIVGFVMTYILHTTHAQKYGARLGLGLTLIQFGLVSLTTTPSELPLTEEITYLYNANATFTETFNSTASATTADALEQLSANYASYASTHEFVSIVIMMLGTLFVCHAFFGFWRIKFLESAMKYTEEVPPPTPEEEQHNRAAISAVLELFHRRSLSLEEEMEAGRAPVGPPEPASEENPERPLDMSEEEARLYRALERTYLI